MSRIGLDPPPARLAPPPPPTLGGKENIGGGETQPTPPPDRDDMEAGLDRLPAPTPDALSGTGGSPLNGLEEEFSADVYAFLALFLQLTQTMKNFSKLESTTELQAQISALISAAEDMKSAAEKRFTSAVAQAIGQIISGTVQVIAGSLALLATYQSVSKENEALGLKDGARDADEQALTAAQIKALEQLSKKLAALGQLGNVAGTGLGQSVTGAAGLAAAQHSRDAELTDAERSEKEALAAQHEKNYQAALEFASVMQEILSATRQTLASMDQQRNESVRATIRG